MTGGGRGSVSGRARRGAPRRQRAVVLCTALWIAAFSAAGVALVGCSARVAGSAIKAGGPAPPAAEAGLLDPGNYPRRPLPPLGTVANEDAGRLVEAHRMANNVVGPWEVDPGLVNGLLEQVHITALPDVGSLTPFFGEDLAGLAGAHHYLLGFSSGRSSVPPPPRQPPNKSFKVLNNAVLRFATPADAAAAAAEMAAKNRGMSRDGVAAAPLPIPRFPATVASVAGVRSGFEAEAFTAHGPYVLYQYAGSKDTAAVVADLIATTLDKQGPLIDHFPATAADRFATLPIDPTGLLARTVPSTTPGVNRPAVYEPHAALHFAPLPAASVSMDAEGGVQREAVDRATVVEAIDATGANRVLEGMVRTLVPWGGYQSMAGITGLPSARCFDRGATGDNVLPRYLCLGVADRYAFKVSANQDLDTRQIAASQYLMLSS